MAKYDAYGTQLKIGTNQVETAVVAITSVTAGDANFTLTASGMTGSGSPTAVTLGTGDSADTVATKAAAALNLDADITALFSVVANGPNVIVTRLVAAANDATLNLAYADDTSGGLTDDATSNDTTAGVALATIAQVQTISGPGLAADTVDVTTHDSTNAWEEVVVSILRSGEVTLDIVYDPAADTHDATGGAGLLTRLENRTLTNFSLVFPDTANTTWAFNGYVNGFEPGEPVEGALTASVTVKISSVPTLV
jgi:predicted secreted protein